MFNSNCESAQLWSSSGCPVLAFRRYSDFDSALYRKHEAKWHFSQENATSHDFQMARLESKPL